MPFFPFPLRPESGPLRYHHHTGDMISPFHQTLWWRRRQRARVVIIALSNLPTFDSGAILFSLITVVPCECVTEAAISSSNVIFEQLLRVVVHTILHGFFLSLVMAFATPPPTSASSNPSKSSGGGGGGSFASSWNNPRCGLWGTFIFLQQTITIQVGNIISITNTEIFQIFTLFSTLSFLLPFL